MLSLLSLLSLMLMPVPLVVTPAAASAGTATNARAMTASSLRFDWTLVQPAGTSVRYWQALTPDSAFRIADPAARATELQRRTLADDLREGGTDGCPAGMVHVRGRMRDPNDTLPRQNRACLDGPTWNPIYLCQRFDVAKLESDSAAHLTLDFCIDRYEYPGVAGEFPGTMLSWNDASEICRARGRRLCDEDEWTFACEGEAALPYPHGYARYLDPTARFPDRIITGVGCHIDVMRRPKADRALLMRHRFAPAGLAELDKLWDGLPAGARTSCTSAFGVRDLTGNLEEWTVQVPGRPRNAHGKPSVLKGGYWTPVRSRCQTAELAHGPGHLYYQTGFRCCANRP